MQALIVLCAAANLCAAPPSQGEFSPSAVLLRTPDISQTQVVFRYAGDLWLAPREGGTASRLTSAEGRESLPKFSPDGTKVAFMADYDGSNEIYVISTAGGAPERLTFHPGSETLAEWHPSGDSVLFFSSEESGIARAPKVFRVSLDGGQPSALPIPYGTFAAIDPSGAWLAYTPLTRENRTWRRYRGGMAQDIWLFNLETAASVRVTDDPGTDRLPMWNGSKLVFQSDRGDRGIANLFEFDPATNETRALTSLATSGARFPSIGPKDVVFEQNGGLFRFDLETEEIARITVSIPGDRPSVRPVTRDLSDVIEETSISRTGKRVAAEARGDIFSVPVEEGITRNLTRTSGIAERAPSLSPDGMWVAYWSDRSGEYELTLRHADGSTFDGADEHGERRLTATGGDWKSEPRWSPNSEKIAWSTQNGDVRLVNVADGPDAAPIDVTTAQFPGYVDVSWSPDSAWLAWSSTAKDSRLDALFLFSVDEKATHQVTSALFDDSEPVFSRCGEWLFFHSSRAFDPTYADLDGTWIYQDSRQLMGVPLHADVEIPWEPTNVEEETETDEDDDGQESGDEDDSDGDDEDESESGDEDEDENEPIRIDIDGFEARVLALPVDSGIFGALTGVDGGVLFALLNEDEESGDLFHFDLESYDDDPEKIIGPFQSYRLTADGTKLAVTMDDKLGVVDLAPGQKLDETVSFDGVRGRFDPREEWTQMIHDIHRLYRDWFYDETMHGVDWDGQRDRMLSALKDATSREDVHFLIGEMLAELNVGHAYNRGPRGGFGRAENVAPVGLLGADWTPVETGFEVKRILGSPNETDGRGPLHGRAQAGDVLIAIDGLPVDPARSIHEHLIGAAGRVVALTFASEGGGRDELVEPIRSERSLRYRDWVAAKRAFVHETTGGKVGYVHVPSTGIDGQTELYRQFLAERTRKALIIDERWNSGGQIPTRFIELLARRPTNAWAMRDGKVFEWPEVYHDGPKTMLINHSAGSGGDAFPWYFRQRGLGPLIGTRTWGGLVGISGNPALIDGASPSVPTFGFFELDGTWGVEGHGVDPDIEVIDDPALMTKGEDPQLDRGILEMLQAMEAWPYASTTRPAPPNRAGAGLPDSDK